MKPDLTGAFIIHMLDPISIIACDEGNIERGRVFKHYQYINSDGSPELWTLSVYFANSEGDVETKVFKLLDRAWRWYRAYMEWEDNNIDTDEEDDQN